MNHLNKTQEFVGMKKADVISLLGTPEVSNGRHFQYYLKTSKKGTDTLRFALGFNNNQKVIIALQTY